MKKRISILLTVALMLTILPLTAMPIHAAQAKNHIIMTKYDSYNKDGKFWMKFKLENVCVNGAAVVYSAHIIDSSGKTITDWDNFVVYPGKTDVRSFGRDYRNLPTGKYTFVLGAYCCDNFIWRYTVNHKAPEPAISFKSYETYYDKDGRFMHKFNIQCSNMKGKALSLKIYNEYGDLVSSNTGVNRKTNNEVGWFAWSGYTDGTRYPPGNYTIIINGGGKTIEKTYYLKILERGMG